MLDALKRAVGVKADVAEQVIALAAHEALLTEFASYKETAEELLAAVTSEKEELAANLAAALEQLESLKQFAEAAEAEKARLVAEAAAAKLVARKEKIVAAVGTERADALMAATEALDDAAFDAIVSAMNLSVEAESKAGMFTEVGAAAQADASKIEETAEMKFLREKYAQK